MFAELKKYEEQVQKVLAEHKDKFKEADLAFAKGCEKAGLPAQITALALIGIHEQVADQLMKAFASRIGLVVEPDKAKDEEE